MTILDATGRHFVDVDEKGLGAPRTRASVGTTSRMIGTDAYLAKLLDSLVDGIVTLSDDCRIVSISGGAERLLRIDAVDYIGAPIDRLIGGLGGTEEGAARRRRTNGEKIAAADYAGRHELTTSTGSAFTGEIVVKRIEDGGQWFDALVIRDVTDKTGLERRLERASMLDPITGLMNRATTLKRIEDELIRLVEAGGKATLVMIDVDRFKSINDVFGHEAGDRMIKALAARLLNLLEPRDIIGRLGGDELVILRPAEDPLRATTELDMLVTDALARPFLVNGSEVFITVSLGAATFPEHAGELDQLLQHAESAAYTAKARGRNNCQVFSPGTINRDPARFRLETELRKAVRQKSLSLAYQPRVDVATGLIQGMEALLRWEHPVLGLVSPAIFVPIAEETGLIDKIGDWVLEAACIQAREWVDQGLPKLKLAVNLSPRQFRDAGLAQRITHLLRATGLPPDYLELEITESSLMNDVEKVVDILHELKRTGVSIAVDDFGTGYSSLSYLKRFPIDVLKIDQSFVAGIPGDGGDVAITTAIIAMAKSLRLRVVAEGVEQPAQWEILRELGCDEAQGYLFGRPLTPAIFADRYSGM